MSSAIDDLVITDYLPHRYPFLMVDRVLEIELEDEKKIRALKNVTVGEPFFRGHFPQQPIMPGVLIVESLAQACGILALKARNMSWKDHGIVFYLGGTDKTRFKKLVGPGDSLILEATVISERRNIMKFKCEALVEESMVCSTELFIVGQ